MPSPIPPRSGNPLEFIGKLASGVVAKAGATAAGASAAASAATGGATVGRSNVMQAVGAAAEDVVKRTQAEAEAAAGVAQNAKAGHFEGMKAAVAGGGSDMVSQLEVEKNFKWVCADAMALPLEDESFDVYTIAFGIRNVTDIPQALREVR